MEVSVRVAVPTVPGAVSVALARPSAAVTPVAVDVPSAKVTVAPATAAEMSARVSRATARTVDEAAPDVGP